MDVGVTGGGRHGSDSEGGRYFWWDLDRRRRISVKTGKGEDVEKDPGERAGRSVRRK